MSAWTPATARKWVVLAVLVLATGAATVAAWRAMSGSPSPEVASSSVVQYLSAADDDDDYARVTEPRPFVFPDDAGPHPDYRTEWWYYTGNLQDPSGRPFGFQLTFFRNAIAPPSDAPSDTPEDGASGWRTGQVYLAHFALSDPERDAFHAAERFARGAAGLAGATASPFEVWLEGWRAAEVGDGSRSASGTMPVRLRAEDGDVAIDLDLAPVKPVALQGEDGYSPKGPQPGNASYYYSLTRMDTAGTVRTPEGVFDVTGLAWMDHEWSTSALDAETQEGWDWFSLQLDDGRELMVFQIREKDGGIAPESSGSLVAEDGAVRYLGDEAFSIEVLDRWRSPRSGAAYPSRWRVLVPEHDLRLEVEPLMADQELDVIVRYWEGAVRVSGTASGAPVSGRGYVELTGYADGGGVPGSAW